MTIETTTATIGGTAANARELVMFDACPLCASPAFEGLRTGDCSRHPSYRNHLSRTMQWMRCTACEHVFRDGYYTDEVCAQIFASVPPGMDVGSTVENHRVISARMVERVAQHVPSGSWLDVGFGTGSLLFSVDEAGFRAIGCDLRADSVDALRFLGFEAYCQEMGTLEFDHPLSVISMADVLEHIPYPRQTIRDAHRLLAPGGALLVSMPNMDCTLWRCLDMAGQNPYWGEMEHVHNFGRRRLYALLEQEGFEVLSYGVSERYRACMEVLARRS